MPWDRKRLLGYVETIQLILGVTDKFKLHSLPDFHLLKRTNFHLHIHIYIHLQEHT